MNEAEQEFYNRVDQKKFKILRGGYPDFALVSRKTGKIFFVEVKSRNQIDNDSTYGLSKEQEQMHYYMSKSGIKTYVWGPGKKIIDPTENGILDHVGENLLSTEQLISIEKVKEITSELVSLKKDLKLFYTEIKYAKSFVDSLPEYWLTPMSRSDISLINQIVVLLANNSDYYHYKAYRKYITTKLTKAIEKIREEINEMRIEEEQQHKQTMIDYRTT